MNLDKLEIFQLRDLELEVKKKIAQREAMQSGNKIMDFTLARCKQVDSHNWQAYGYVEGKRVVVSLGKTLAGAEEKILREIEKRKRISEKS